MDMGILAQKTNWAAHLVSETRTMLETSLGNLQRAGFREIHEKEVYGRSDAMAMPDSPATA